MESRSLVAPGLAIAALIVVLVLLWLMDIHHPAVDFLAFRR